MLTRFGDYKPEGLAPLWVEADLYLPKGKFVEWEESTKTPRDRNARKPYAI